MKPANESAIMAEQTQTEKVTQSIRKLVYFDDRAALHLTQAFAQEVELEPLVLLLFNQLQAVGKVCGLNFAFKPLSIDLNHGEQLHHKADYKLSFRDTPLGCLTLFFAKIQKEAEVQTCEDLISMAFLSLRNALTTLQLRNQSASLSQPEQQALHNSSVKADTLPKEPKTDALILLALDDYPTIKARDGDEWAQILMSSVHEQISEGLRGADGVYHIGDDQIAVLLPNTTATQANEVAKKVRTLIASLHLRGGEISQQLTVCQGLADAAGAKSAEAVMSSAKEALSAAQAKGHNEIGLFQTGDLSRTIQSSG